MRDSSKSERVYPNGVDWRDLYLPPQIQEAVLCIRPRQRIPSPVSVHGTGGKDVPDRLPVPPHGKVEREGAF